MDKLNCITQNSRNRYMIYKIPRTIKTTPKPNKIEPVIRFKDLKTESVTKFLSFFAPTIFKISKAKKTESKTTM